MVGSTGGCRGCRWPDLCTALWRQPVEEEPSDAWREKDVYVDVICPGFKLINS